MLLKLKNRDFQIMRVYEYFNIINSHLKLREYEWKLPE